MTGKVAKKCVIPSVLDQKRTIFRVKISIQKSGENLIRELVIQNLSGSQKNLKVQSMNGR